MSKENWLITIMEALFPPAASGGQYRDWAEAEFQLGERRGLGGDFDTQQLTGGRLPAQTKLQAAADAGILPVGPADPVHRSAHQLPALGPGTAGHMVQRGVRAITPLCSGFVLTCAETGRPGRRGSGAVCPPPASPPSSAAEPAESPRASGYQHGPSPLWTPHTATRSKYRQKDVKLEPNQTCLH